MKANKDLKLSYSTEEPGFKALIECIVLGSAAHFEFSPEDAEVSKKIG